MNNTLKTQKTKKKKKNYNYDDRHTQFLSSDLSNYPPSSTTPLNNNERPSTNPKSGFYSFFHHPLFVIMTIYTFSILSSASMSKDIPLFLGLINHNNYQPEYLYFTVMSCCFQIGTACTLPFLALWTDMRPFHEILLLGSFVGFICNFIILFSSSSIFFIVVARLIMGVCGGIYYLSYAYIIRKESQYKTSRLLNLGYFGLIGSILGFILGLLSSFLDNPITDTINQFTLSSLILFLLFFILFIIQFIHIFVVIYVPDDSLSYTNISSYEFTDFTTISFPSFFSLETWGLLFPAFSSQLAYWSFLSSLIPYTLSSCSYEATQQIILYLSLVAIFCISYLTFFILIRYEIILNKILISSLILLTVACTLIFQFTPDQISLFQYLLCFFFAIFCSSIGIVGFPLKYCSYGSPNIENYSLCTSVFFILFSLPSGIAISSTYIIFSSPKDMDFIGYINFLFLIISLFLSFISPHANWYVSNIESDEQDVLNRLGISRQSAEPLLPEKNGL